MLDLTMTAALHRAKLIEPYPPPFEFVSSVELGESGTPLHTKSNTGTAVRLVRTTGACSQPMSPYSTLLTI